MKNRIFAFALSMTLMAVFSMAGDETPLKDQKAKESYSLGYDFGARLKRQGSEIDTETLISAVRSGLTGKEPALTPQEIGETLRGLRRKTMIQADRQREEAAARNLEKGKAFLAENKTKEGVVTLPSGLQYKVMREGSGPVPKADDSVTVNYRGTLTDGTEFDNSVKRGGPATITVTGVIKGWSEALQLMKTGAKWQLFIPEELAYGKRQFGRIQPNSTLIFELELVSISKEAKPGVTSRAPEGKSPSTK